VGPVRKLVVDQDRYVGRFVAIDSVEGAGPGRGLSRSDQFYQRVSSTGGLPPRARAGQGKVAQARANLAYVQKNLDRGAQSVKDVTIPQQTYDQRLQPKNVAEAIVKAQEAAIATACLDHEFTELHAPVSGRVGDRRALIGNLVMGGIRHADLARYRRVG
jgi:membrane fusion protein, multidrug efflux system